MSLNFGDKGIYRALKEDFSDAGYPYRERDGVQVYNPVNEVAMQAIIDSFDPPLSEVARSLPIVKQAAFNARARYVTPGKDLVYELKRTQSEAYKSAGYPADTAPYPMIESEAAATGRTAQQAADSILATASKWMALAANIETIERTAVLTISSEINADVIDKIATTAIAKLDAI